MHRRDRVRVPPYPFLEQLVESAVRQLATGPGEPLQLEPPLLGGQQVPLAVRGVGVRGDQRERGQVIAGDPRGVHRVDRVRPVPQPQDCPTTMVEDPDLQRHSDRAVAVADGIEDGLERRAGHAQLAPKIVHREVGVPQQLRLGPVSLAHELAPRDGLRRQRARQRPAIRAGDVADHDLPLTGQGRQHDGVRSQ